MPLVVHVTTVPQSLAFVTGLAPYLRVRGHRMVAVSSPGAQLTAFGRNEGVEVFAVPMSRRVTPWKDAGALGRLSVLFRRLSPDIVHAHTPKAGLLGMIAASLAGVPNRIYHLRGLPLLTAVGARRALLFQAERVSCRLANLVLSEGPSLRREALALSLCPPGKMRVLGLGSNGVDAEGRFNPERWPKARAQIRADLSIAEDALVLGFVGRLVKDKGIAELLEAWRVFRRELPHAHLLLVGPFEDEDPVPRPVREELERDPRVRWVGWKDEPAPFYAAMDIFCLPSRREGFPNAPLEAAAMGLPVVITRVPGAVDAVVEDETGIFVPPDDPPALLDALRRYARSPGLRVRHGQLGQARVRRDFRREPIHEATFRTYQALLGR